MAREGEEEKHIFVCWREKWSLDKFDGTFYLSYTHQDMTWFKMVSLIGGILGLNIHILADVALNKVCLKCPSFSSVVEEKKRKNVCCKENWLLDKFDETFYLSYTHQNMSWFKIVSV